MRGRGHVWLVVLTVILFMGCASSGSPPNYYGLQATHVDPGNLSQSPFTIGMGPVQLPEYLDRAAIVTRVSPTRLQINANQRWAGSLQSEILRVLAANIKNETGSRQVVVFPWGSDVEPVIRFRVAIHAFEGNVNHSVRLKATWSMEVSASSKAKVIGDSEVVEKVNGNDFEDLAEAMGRALSVMSHEMAAAAMSAGEPVARGVKP